MITKARFASVLGASLSMTVSALAQWSTPVQLIQPGGAAGDLFGNRVAISGDTLVVTAHYDDVGAHAGQGSASVYRRTGTGWAFEAMLTAADGAAEDHFGTSVVIAGDTVVIGAEFDDVGGNTDQGSAYVFTRSGKAWTQQAKLVAPDGGAGDFFGYSCTLSGDTLAVGAFGDQIGSQPRQGSAYVFTRSGAAWTQQAKLTASDGEAIDYFGTSVALSAGADTLVIGAARDTVDGDIDRGSAYIFTRSGAAWTQQAKIIASDGKKIDAFGFSVAILGDTVFVSAYVGDVEGNIDQGSVYVYTRSGAAWTQRAKLTASDGAAGDDFGWSLAVSNTAGLNALVIGAGTDDMDGDLNRGSAYIFTGSGATWTQRAKLTAPDGARYDWFGTAVAISTRGDTVVVGSFNDDIGAHVEQGSAWVFSRGLSKLP